MHASALGQLRLRQPADPKSAFYQFGGIFFLHINAYYYIIQSP